MAGKEIADIVPVTALRAISQPIVAVSVRKSVATAPWPSAEPT